MRGTQSEGYHCPRHHLSCICCHKFRSVPTALNGSTAPVPASPHRFRDPQYQTTRAYAVRPLPPLPHSNLRGWDTAAPCEQGVAPSHAIGTNRAHVEELKKVLDKPEAKAISERYDAMLNEIKEEDKLYANRLVTRGGRVG